MEIEVKLFNVDCRPEISPKGDWIDLKAAKDVVLKRPKTNEFVETNYDFTMVPLGVAMKLPKGYEAVIAPRSSTFQRYGVIMTNSIGVIDNTYCGNGDEWKMPCLCLGIPKTYIRVGDRICQFRVQLSQKATLWQKIKHLFDRGVRFKFVDTLSDTNRGGFGSTGR